MSYKQIQQRKKDVCLRIKWLNTPDITWNQYQNTSSSEVLPYKKRRRVGKKNNVKQRWCHNHRESWAAMAFTTPTATEVLLSVAGLAARNLIFDDLSPVKEFWRKRRSHECQFVTKKHFLSMSLVYYVQGQIEKKSLQNS